MLNNYLQTTQVEFVIFCNIIPGTALNNLHLIFLQGNNRVYMKYSIEFLYFFC